VTLDALNSAVDPFTITTSDPIDLGAHTVTYTYEVAGLPAQTKTFDVTVQDSCTTTTISWSPGVISPVTQTVFDAAQSVTFDTAGLSESLGTCGSFTFEIVPASGGHTSVLSLQDPLANTLTSESTSLTQVGIYTGLQIKASLVNYPAVAPALSVPFDLTVLDPCLSATLSSSVIADIMTSVLASPVATSTFTAFTDSVSTAQAGTNLCGPIEYSITSVIARGSGTASITEITLDSASKTVSAAPTLNDHIDSYDVVIEAKLTNYPLVT